MLLRPILLNSTSSETELNDPFSTLSKLITVCDQARSMGLRIMKMIFASGTRSWTWATLSLSRAE